MTNTAPKDHILKRLLPYLYSLASHFIYFSSIIICANLIHYPHLLQQSLFLATGVVAFLITFSQTLLTLEQTSCIFVYNRKTFRENPLSNNTATKLLYSLKNLFLITSNTLLFSAAIFLFVYTPPLSTHLLVAFFVFHAIHLIKDYFSSTTSLDFLSSRCTLPSSTINGNDPLWMSTLSRNISPGLLDKHELRCQFHTISGTELNQDELNFTQSTSVLTEPIRLNNFKTGESIWAEKDTVLKYSRQLSSWLISDHTHPAVQTKISQIRSFLSTMHDRESQFTSQFNPLRSLIESNDFREYNQAI